MPLDMCNQKRFKEDLLEYVEIKEINEEVEIRVDETNEKDYLKYKFRKLQFCPTYIVTGQVFRQIF